MPGVRSARVLPQPRRRIEAVGQTRSDRRSGILALQRLAGNRAVCELLGGPPGSRVAVQRDLGDLLGGVGDLLAAGARAVTSAPLLLADAATHGPATATVRMMIRNGVTDESTLTNAAFFVVHPELPWGIKLKPTEIPEHQPLAEEWAALRKRVVRPELAKARAGGPGGGAGTGSGSVPSRPAGPASADSKTFLDTHRDLLTALPASEDELLLMLDIALKKGSKTRIEYTAYDYERPTPLPLVHSVFVARHPDVDPLTSITDAEGKRTAAVLSSWEAIAAKAGGWDAIGVSEAHWTEIKAIRDTVAYPFMRIVLPRVEGPGTLDPAAGAGQRIAHQAHAYLGVRYQLGGSYRGKDPWAADPAAEEGASLDCSALVRRVLKDLGLPWEKGKSAGGSNVPQLGDSPDMAAVDSPEAGDLLLRTGHVGIYIGGGELIHAPHSGKVVSKEPYDASKWTGIRRYRPRPAP